MRIIWLKIRNWLLALFGVGVALAAPVIPADMKWVSSYETIGFETQDGDLGFNEYAIDPNDGTFYIREVPKNEGQFSATTSSEAIIGKTEVAIRGIKSADNPNCVGCAYYSEFVGRDGKVKRVSYEGRYKDLIEVKDAPQPNRKELVSFLSPDKSEAAIAHDANSDSTTKLSVTSFSWSHTSTGSNLVLYIGVSSIDVEDVTDATYNSVSMTERLETDGTSGTVSSWYLANPSTGANTVAVTVTSGSYRAVGTTLTGVDQTTPVDASNSNTGSATIPTVSVTTVADNSWVIDTVAWDSSAFLPGAAGAGQTATLACTTINTNAICASREGPKTPAGSVTMNWGAALFAQNYASNAVSFQPVIASASAVPSSNIIWFDSD